MTPYNFALLTSWLVLATLVWAGVIFLLPRTLRSLYRYRLWNIRDSVIDDILRNRISHSPIADDVVGMVEFAIESSRSLTCLKVILYEVPEHVQKGHAKFFRDEMDKLPKEEQAILWEYVHRFHVAIVRQMMFGSISGWVVSMIFAGLILPTFMTTQLSRTAWKSFKEAFDRVAFARLLGQEVLMSMRSLSY